MSRTSPPVGDVTSAPLVLGSSPLTCPVLAQAARGERVVQIDAGARGRVAAGHDRAVALVAQRHVYGRTTGVGANRDVTLTDPDGRPAPGKDEESAYVRSLLRSHATTAGPERGRDRVRGMLVVRLHQLCGGTSGVRVEVVEALLEMVQRDALPTVRELGGVGTGDLPGLAAAALALSGERVTTPPVPRTVDVALHDALPFLSSGAATIADSALAQDALARLSRAAVVVAGLTCAAVHGNPEAFSRPVEAAAFSPGTRQVCRWMRRLVDGASPGDRIQDPYGLRALPQVHGTLLDALRHLGQVVEGHANSPGENPMVVVPFAGQAGQGPPDPATDVPHNGAFHLAPLATALDTVRSAVVQSGQLVQRRMALMVDPAYTTATPFLSDGVAGSSGVMPLEYVAASSLATLRVLATPVATGTTTLSRGAEDDASFASTGARLTLDVAAPLRVLLAGELVTAVRGVRRRGAPAGAPELLSEVLDLCRDLPHDDRDRDLSDDLEIADGLLDRLSRLL